MKTRTILKNVKEYFNANDIVFSISTKVNDDSYLIMGFKGGYKIDSHAVYLQYFESKVLELNLKVGYVSTPNDPQLQYKLSRAKTNDIIQIERHSTGLIIKRTLMNVSDDSIVQELNKFVNYYYNDKGREIIAYLESLCKKDSK